MTKAVKHLDSAAKRAQWAKRIGEWERSGQTQRAFCAQRGLSLWSLHWWRARLKRVEKAKTGVAFLPMAITAQPPESSGALIEIELRSKTRLRFEGEAALRALDRLIARVR